MAHLNFTDFYQVPDLQFDINKMRSDLSAILEKKGFKSPEGITNFGAIPLIKFQMMMTQLKETR